MFMGRMKNEQWRNNNKLIIGEEMEIAGEERIM
jgi:hypothetical protein